MQRPVHPMAGSDGTGGCAAAPGPPAPGSLAPPWAPVTAALAILFTAVLSGRVWHSTGLPGVDAWTLDLLGAQSDERQFRLATEVASGLRALTVTGILATALVAWRALRWWSAVALALLAPATTLAIERLLKLLVARRAAGTPVVHYPSGHVAVATALVLSLVLILRPAMARPRVKLSIGLSVALLVPLMAWARLVETAHLLTDVIGGVSTGVAVTLGIALLLDRSIRGILLELHPQGLGKAGVQRADREHRQRDHGRRNPRAVDGGDEDAEQDWAADRAQDPGHAHPAPGRGPDTDWEPLGADRPGEHQRREDGEEVPCDRGRR
jgi:membrane-associated phospholipid phosphatase